MCQFPAQQATTVVLLVLKLLHALVDALLVTTAILLATTALT